MDIMELAIQLGMALAESKEVLALREKDSELQNDMAAMGIVKGIQVARQQISDAMMQENPDMAQVDKLSTDLDELEKLAAANDKIQASNKAQQDFSGLMSRINAVLRFYITGDSDSDSNGCGGGCSGCSGCH
ncbi:MAG: YlbF family regulator [Christensenellales bacterium]|jgi:cell fate (sporulation/competence/biofilm development) regulator YlbF (YheA/YmcA/DUF963 family)